ncbi:MAG: di-trans,poly-cis-decaprenylcistransferase [Candidatus Korarchaeota archaeon]|nr:di-trans,poly-cis-decaprenylcistransferase [Candidatus Korarchaeota archaeon]
MGLLDILYKLASKIQMPLYQRYLETKVRGGEIPEHIAIILDGNRRFAKKIGIGWAEAYKLGADRVEEVLNWLAELGVKHVTLYAFSTENFSRPKEQVEAVFNVIERKFMELLERVNELEKNSIRFRVIGRKELIPQRILELASKLEEATKNYGPKTINVALAYGGRSEIVDSVRKIAEKVAKGEIKPDEIDEEVIRSHLYAPDLPDPDLIIRTSGEERLSNFLLWQSAYSELYFCEAYLPEFRKIDLLRAIRDYQRRKRRFGV